MGNIVTCGPNTALVVSGGRESSIRIGGRAIVIPCLQRVDQLSLELRTLLVKSVNATTLQGVQISVEGIAQVKVSGFHENDNQVLSTDMNAIRLAAQHFLGSTDKCVHGGPRFFLFSLGFGGGTGGGGGVAWESSHVTSLRAPLLHVRFCMDMC